MDEVKIRETLKKYNQEQLLDFYDELDKLGKERLLKDIETIDFNKTEICYKDSIE